MTHDEFEAIAALDALGAATADEGRAMTAHLATCDPCRRARDEYAEAATGLVLSLEPVAPPADLRERVLGSARSAGLGRRVHRDRETRNRATSTWWLATAATLFLALWGWREVGIRVAREHIVRPAGRDPRPDRGARPPGHAEREAGLARRAGHAHHRPGRAGDVAGGLGAGLPRPHPP